MSTAASMGQALFGLIAVLAVIAALAWLARRFAPAASARGALLKNIAALTLGPRERVVVVEVADTWLVLGVTAQQISTLHTLPRTAQENAPSATTGVAAEQTVESPAARAFAAVLANLRHKGK
jgi:flagellar protein FliO/FliZ